MGQIHNTTDTGSHAALGPFVNCVLLILEHSNTKCPTVLVATRDLLHGILTFLDKVGIQ